MSTGEETKRFEIIFEGDGRSSGKMRNDITVTWVGADQTFELATDEGPFHGGDNTAPPPLAPFTAGLTGCLMTQIRAFSKRLKIPIRGCNVKARIRWEGVQEGNDPYVTAPLGFDMDVDIDSDATLDELKMLLNAAKKGCFLEQTLSQANTVGHRLRYGGEWLEA